MPKFLKTLLIAHNSSSELPSLRETILSFVVPPSGRLGQTEDLLHTVATLHHALSEIQAGWFPDLVVVHQSVPDEFPQSQIDELIGLLPLARFIVAFSPWCESIGRTEQRWPVAWCVPIRHLETRLQRELASLETGATSPTASRDEAFSESATRVNSAATEFSAVVFGDDRHFVETVRDQLTAAGMTVISVPSSPDFVFVSATRMSTSIDEELTRLRKEFPESEIVLICDLLTPGEVVRLKAEAVTSISQLRFGEDLVALVNSRPARTVR